MFLYNSHEAKFITAMSVFYKQQQGNEIKRRRLSFSRKKLLSCNFLYDLDNLARRWNFPGSSKFRKINELLMDLSKLFMSAKLFNVLMTHADNQALFLTRFCPKKPSSSTLKALNILCCCWARTRTENENMEEINKFLCV